MEYDIYEFFLKKTNEMILSYEASYHINICIHLDIFNILFLQK